MKIKVSSQIIKEYIEQYHIYGLIFTGKPIIQAIKQFKFYLIVDEFKKFFYSNNIVHKSILLY